MKSESGAGNRIRRMEPRGATLGTNTSFSQLGRYPSLPGRTTQDYSMRRAVLPTDVWLNRGAPISVSALHDFPALLKNVENAIDVMDVELKAPCSIWMFASLAPDLARCKTLRIVAHNLQHNRVGASALG